MLNSEWRLLDLKLSSYAGATPLVSTLLKLKSEEKIPNTLALLTFEKSSVCLFYYNDPEKEVDLPFCREKDIEIGRRDTGGSPYWADPGTLLIFFCLDRRQVAGFPDTISEGYRFLIGASAQAISERFGIPAVYRPLNDLEVMGKKIAGHTVTFLGNTCRWGCGPQVLKPRMDLMSRALKVPPEKYADKEVKTVEARVTNFEELLGRPPSFEEIKANLHLRPGKGLKGQISAGKLNPGRAAAHRNGDGQGVFRDLAYGYDREKKIWCTFARRIAKGGTRTQGSPGTSDPGCCPDGRRDHPEHRFDRFCSLHTRPTGRGDGGEH